MHRADDYEHRMSRILSINFLVLVVLVILPAGSYVAHGATVRISSLSSPFADYGVFLATSAVVDALLIGISTRLYGRHRRVSPIGYVMVAGGVLGLMAPDIITSANRSVPIGANGHLVQVGLLFGFWLTFAAAILLFTIASVAFFERSKTRNSDRYDSLSYTQTLERT